MLFVALLATSFHASVSRRGPMQRRSVVLLASVVMLVVAATPVALKQTTDAQLQSKLQPSQEANASNQSNLALERVDFSTRPR